MIGTKKRFAWRTLLLSFGLFGAGLSGTATTNADTLLAAAVLPTSRSVQVADTATLFATIINAGDEVATNCQIEPPAQLAANVSYQTTDVTTNQVIGLPNAPVSIPAGGSQSFLIAITPTQPITATELKMGFLCDNAPDVSAISGVNTFTFSASTAPGADLIALAATPTADGVIVVPSRTNTAGFSIASINVGAGDALTVTAEATRANLPATIRLCESDPATGACVNPTTPTSGEISITVASGETPTFAVFVETTGLINFAADVNRIAVRFADRNGALRGATSVAVRSEQSASITSEALLGTTLWSPPPATERVAWDAYAVRFNADNTGTTYENRLATNPTAELTAIAQPFSWQLINGQLVQSYTNLFLLEETSDPREFVTHVEAAGLPFSVVDFLRTRLVAGNLIGPFKLQRNLLRRTSTATATDIDRLHVTAHTTSIASLDETLAINGWQAPFPASPPLIEPGESLEVVTAASVAAAAGQTAEAGNRWAIPFPYAPLDPGQQPVGYHIDTLTLLADGTTTPGRLSGRRFHWSNEGASLILESGTERHRITTVLQLGAERQALVEYVANGELVLIAGKRIALGDGTGFTLPGDLIDVAPTGSLDYWQPGINTWPAAARAADGRLLLANVFGYIFPDVTTAFQIIGNPAGSTNCNDSDTGCFTGGSNRMWNWLADGNETIQTLQTSTIDSTRRWEVLSYQPGGLAVLVESAVESYAGSDPQLTIPPRINTLTQLNLDFYPTELANSPDLEEALGEGSGNDSAGGTDGGDSAGNAGDDGSSNNSGSDGGTDGGADGEAAGGTGAGATNFVMDDVLMHGGGTHNAINFSPDGTRVAAFADVGGSRRIDRSQAQWEYLPTTGANADRSVAGGIILNDGTVFALAGNSANSGRLLEYAPDGGVTELVTNLNVRGNSTTPGDAGPRPRPVGWMVAYDSVNDLIYVCENDGLLRYNRATHTNEGRIALEGESCRGIAHNNSGLVDDTHVLTVSTRANGLVRLWGVQGDDVLALRISDQDWTRFEDAALVNPTKGTLLGAGYTKGLYRYDDGGIELNAGQVQTGPTTSLVTSNYTIGAEVSLSNWETATGTLMARWTGTPSEQQHRLSIEGNGQLRYRYRHAGGFASYTSSTGVTLTGRAWVRFRRTGTQAVFEQSQDGHNWTAVGQPLNGFQTPNSVSGVHWAAGATTTGGEALPGGTILHRAWVSLNDQSKPIVSLDATGLVANANSYIGINGDRWSLAGKVLPGGVDVTPAQKAPVGANDAETRWATVATTQLSATDAIQAVGASINPDSATEWLYRTTDIESATRDSWGNASPTRAIQEIGSSDLNPPNRVLGGNVGNGGDNLTGLWHLAFDPADAQGNTLVASGTLSVYISTNFAESLDDIQWRTYNQGLSMFALTDVHIDAEGGVLFTAADHNSLTVSGRELLTTEPTRVGVTGPADGFCVTSVGTGRNKVSVMCATDDISPFESHGDLVFHQGTDVPQSWSTTGYQSDTNGMGALSPGQVPRPGGAFGWDNTDGSYSFVVWGDGVGFIRATYSLATRSWSPWTRQTSGPATNLVTANINQERIIVGKPDGSLLMALQASNTTLWRSTDGGANWSRFATNVNGNELARKGRMAYNPRGDWLMISTSAGLYRANNVSTTPSVTTLSNTISVGPVAIDQAGRAYVHTHEPNRIRLLRFDDFGAATSPDDATDIAAGTPFSTRAGQFANDMAIGLVDGAERGITIYQGAGASSWLVPDGL